MSLVFSIASCGSSTDCTTAKDCFEGEVCVSGSCRVAGENNANNVNNANNLNNQNNQNNANNQNNVSNNGTPGLCDVDPFGVMCEADDNDDIGRPIESIETQGCDNNDVFTEGSGTVTSRLCALESVDKWDQVLIGCRNATFIAEAIFEPKKACPDDYELSIYAQGSNCAEQDDDPDVQCIFEEDGTVTAQFIIRDSNSVENLRVIIDKGDDSTVDLEYDLTINIRR